jgi:hypothetical protein
MIFAGKNKMAQMEKMQEKMENIAYSISELKRLGSEFLLEFGLESFNQMKKKAETDIFDNITKKIPLTNNITLKTYHF